MLLWITLYNVISSLTSPCIIGILNLPSLNASSELRIGKTPHPTTLSSSEVSFDSLMILKRILFEGLALFIGG